MPIYGRGRYPDVSCEFAQREFADSAITDSFHTSLDKSLVKGPVVVGLLWHEHHCVRNVDADHII